LQQWNYALELSSQLVVFIKDQVTLLCVSAGENSEEKPLLTGELQEQVLCDRYFSGLSKKKKPNKKPQSPSQAV